METKIWINITFNAENRIKGKNEFMASLQQDGVVIQERKTWLPAACTGQEIEIFQILINSDFLKDVVIYGAAWDIFKEFCKVLFPNLKSLKDYNAELSIGCLDFEFNDISIKIQDLYNADYICLMNAFVDMTNHLEHLNQNEITEIKEITLPYIQNTEYSEEGDTRKYITPIDFTDQTDFLWKIAYNNGCNTCYYNPKTKEIIIE